MGESLRPNADKPDVAYASTVEACCNASISNATKDGEAPSKGVVLLFSKASFLHAGYFCFFVISSDIIWPSF